MLLIFWSFFGGSFGLLEFSAPTELDIYSMGSSVCDCGLLLCVLLLFFAMLVCCVLCWQRWRPEGLHLDVIAV